MQDDILLTYRFRYFCLILHRTRHKTTIDNTKCKVSEKLLFTITLAITDIMVRHHSSVTNQL